jgi:hypothetical protein
MSPTDRESGILRFLLGEAQETERAEIERLLLTESGFEDELLAVRDELLEDYVLGALGPRDRERLEQHLLTIPLHRERLDAIRDMLSVAGRTGAADGIVRRSAARGWGWRPWAQAAVLAVLVVAAGVALHVARPRDPGPTRASLAPMPTPSATPLAVESPPEALVAETREPRVRLPEAPTASVDIPTPPNANVVRIVVPMAAARSSFSAVLREAPDGREVWRADELVRSKTEHTIELAIPARVLAAANYTLSIASERMRDPDAPPRITLEYRLRVRAATASPR